MTSDLLIVLKDKEGNEIEGSFNVKYPNVVNEKFKTYWLNYAKNFINGHTHSIEVK